MTIETKPPAESQEPAPFLPVPPQRQSLYRRIRQVFFGKPISSEHAEHTLLPKFLALPVFSSEAYATQQILLALGMAGLYEISRSREYTHYTMLITGLIVALLAIVVIS